MTQYNTLNAIINQNCKKMKSEICNKKWNWSNFKLFIKHYLWSNNKNNFPHTLLLTYAPVLKLHIAFANKFSANTKLSYKTQWYKRGQSGWFLGERLRPLLKTG